MKAMLSLNSRIVLVTYFRRCNQSTLTVPLSAVSGIEFCILLSWLYDTRVDCTADISHECKYKRKAL